MHYFKALAFYMYSKLKMATILSSLGLGTSQKRLLFQFSNRFNFLYNEEVCPETKIVVLDRRKIVEVVRSRGFAWSLVCDVKYVDIAWIVGSLEPGAGLMNQHSFELKSSELRAPAILKGIPLFIASISCPDTQYNRMEMEVVIRFYGGRLIHTPDLLQRKLVIIGDSGIFPQLSHVKKERGWGVVSFDWILESIEQGERLPVEDFLLS